MARARNIKPGFFTNELLGTYEPIISLLFAGLWCLADKHGILEERPLRIKAELFPYREGLDINGYLTVLERDAFLTRYEVDGVRYVQINNFEKHQSPHHTEKAKGYPHPTKHTQGNQGKCVLTPLNNGERTVSERSDSLIPDSLIPEEPPSAPVVREKTQKPKDDSFDFRSELISLGVTPGTADDWMLVRKAAKAINTRTALNGLKTQVEKSGWTYEQAISLCCERNWRGFEARYVSDIPKPAPKQLPVEQYEAKRREDMRIAREAYDKMQQAWTVPPKGPIRDWVGQAMGVQQ
jgi:hypothetical protein